MKILCLISLISTILISCSDNSAQNRESTSQQVTEKSNPKPKKLSWEEERDSILNALGVKTRDEEKIIREICDTSFTIKKTDIIKIKDTCNFEPFMLIVKDEKLIIHNKTFDSIYQPKLPLKVQAASWSPYNKRELFVLLKDPKKLSEKDKQDYYLEEMPFNLKLYKFSLDSLNMSRLSTFYDNSLPVCKLYELSEYFPAKSQITIDKENDLLYYDCISIHPDPEYVENNGTYIVNLKNRKTTLKQLIEYDKNSLTGEEVPFYSNSYLKNTKYKLEWKSDRVSISNFPGKETTIEIPIDIISNNDLDYQKLKKDKALDIIIFNICFIPGGSKFLVSPTEEIEMGQMKGNIYLIDENKKPILLINDEVIGYYSVLKNYNNELFFIETYNKLYIYDSGFSLIKKHEELHQYEIVNYLP